MKSLSIMVLVLMSFAVSAGYDDTMAVHKKYCQMKVAKACAMIECDKDPKNCSKKMLATLDKADEALAKDIQKRCGKDQACRKMEDAKKYESDTKECRAGVAKACFEKDFADVQKLPN